MKTEFEKPSLSQATPTEQAPSRPQRGWTMTDLCKVLAFFITLAAAFVVGLLLFLRPAVSEVEGRELTAFPEFTWERFADGTYFADITTWYADTYPGRDRMISMQHRLKELYGIRQEQLIKPPTTPPEDEGNVERWSDGLYIKGGSAFEIYIYDDEKASRYAEVLNLARERMPNVTVYSMVVPLSYSVYMNRKEWESIGASDAADSIARIYGKMGQGVHTVSVLPELMAHQKDYLYFHTDHHWTARGAYQAYRALCREMGIAPKELEDWEHLTFTGFFGSQQSKVPDVALKEDYVEAWVPSATNRMTVYTWDGDQKIVADDWPIIRKETGNGAGIGCYYGPRWKYNCFIAGDHPLTVIENPRLQDGSKILVVKDSYGNAFSPFLVDQFQTVYVADIRSFVGRMGMSLPEYVEREGITQVVFVNNINTVSTPWLVGCMEGLLQ